MDNLSKNEQDRKRLAAVRIGFAIAGGLIGWAFGYGGYTLLAAWIDNLDVTRGHVPDFVELFALWSCEWLAFYFGIPIVAITGGIIGANYFAPRFFSHFK
jgi:hypothetical protein